MWKFLEKGLFFRADMAGLGKYCMGGYGLIGVYRVIYQPSCILVNIDIDWYTLMEYYSHLLHIMFNSLKICVLRYFHRPYTSFIETLSVVRLRHY